MPFRKDVEGMKNQEECALVQLLPDRISQSSYGGLCFLCLTVAVSAQGDDVEGMGDQGECSMILLLLAQDSAALRDVAIRAFK